MASAVASACWRGNVGDDDVRACLGQCERRGLADALARARYQRDLIGQIHGCSSRMTRPMLCGLAIAYPGSFAMLFPAASS